METETNSKNILILTALLIITAACVLRFAGLGGASLTLNESENALAALNLFGGEGAGQLLYTLPTALIFKMFGDTDFTARLFPALSGALLAVIPLLLSRKYGFRKMLLLSFLFAVDPVLLFWSKRADAVIPVLALSAAAFASLIRWTASVRSSTMAPQSPLTGAS